MSLQDTIEDKDKAIIEIVGLLHRTIDRASKVSKELEAAKMLIEVQQKEAHELQTRIGKLNAELQIYRVRDNQFYLQVGGNYTCSVCKWQEPTIDAIRVHIRERH